MPAKRRTRPKRIPRIRLRRGNAINVTRAEFDAVINRLNERGELVNEMRRELHATCHDLAAQVEKNRQALDIQFTRIAQLQHELDVLRRRA